MLECKENQLQACRVSKVNATVRLDAPSPSFCFWSNLLTDRMVWAFFVLLFFKIPCVVLHTFHVIMPWFQTLLDTVFWIYCSSFFFFSPTNMYCLFDIFIISVLLFTNIILLLHRFFCCFFLSVESGHLCASWVILCYSSPGVSLCQSHLIVFVTYTKTGSPPNTLPTSRNQPLNRYHSYRQVSLTPSTNWWVITH